VAGEPKSPLRPRPKVYTCDLGQLEGHPRAKGAGIYKGGERRAIQSA
jgi:hypothetical protein